MVPLQGVTFLVDLVGKQVRIGLLATGATGSHTISGELKEIRDSYLLVQELHHVGATMVFAHAIAFTYEYDAAKMGPQVHAV
jgi:hypothetical protein